MKTEFSRRTLLMGAAALTAASTLPGMYLSNAHAAEVVQKTPVIGSKNVTGMQTPGSRARVYFTRHIDVEHLVRIYGFVNQHIFGKVAIKLHTGEKHGPNILPPALVEALQKTIPNSSLVETNTLYPGDRGTTADHRETLKINGWTFCPVDILDEEEDVSLPVRNGLHLKEVAMGGHLVNYDSLVLLTHFKGHARGGFGGSMKNIAIGCASGQVGKRQVHGVGEKLPATIDGWPGKEPFMENMADSAKAVCDFFGPRMTYINIMRRMSVDCDCAGTSAAEPTLPDLGICASTDILAVDQACCDIVFGMPESVNHDLVERIQSRHGLRQLSAMAELGMGNPQYELIDIDKA